MLLNVQINIDNNTDLYDIEQDIVNTASRQLINEVMNNRYDNYGSTFRDNLHKKIKEMLLETMDTDFKEDIKKQVSEELSKKYERTKQYKELKETYSIDSDAVIKSGLKELVAEMVTVEIKKRFK